MIKNEMQKIMKDKIGFERIEYNDDPDIVEGV